MCMTPTESYKHHQKQLTPERNGGLITVLGWHFTYSVCKRIQTYFVGAELGVGNDEELFF